MCLNFSFEKLNDFSASESLSKQIDTIHSIACDGLCQITTLIHILRNILI